jgi:FtsP/CotA-like multicopper oxidase with cupredoxin domain
LGEKKHTCIELKYGDNSKPQLWELFNNSGELHNFHIHQMKFRLATTAEIKRLGIDPPKKSSTCQGQEKCATPDYKLYNDETSGVLVSKLSNVIGQKGEVISSILEWHDTIPVPRNERVYVMMSLADKVQVSRFVYHCHILGHEDNGLMAPIEVWDPSASAARITQ